MMFSLKIAEAEMKKFLIKNKLKTDQVIQLVVLMFFSAFFDEEKFLNTY